MARVDLYFGAGLNDTRAWRRFLESVVTPRFPDGFTSVDGFGQWKDPRGIAREISRVLTIYYRPDATSDARIEAIRSRYKATFRQVSVLRADETACVAF